MEPQRACPGRLGHASCKLPLIGMAKSNGSCQPDQFMLWKAHTNALGWHALQPQNSKFGIAAVGPASKIGTTFQGLSTLSHRVWQSWCGECCGELHTFSPPVASVLWGVQAKVWKMCLWCGISNTVWDRLERASMLACAAQCPIGDCREAVPTDGASEPPRVGAGRRTCSKHWASLF